MSDGSPDGGSSADGDWEPVFPWERAAGWLGSTERGRFVAYNVLVFVLLGVAFALPSGVRSVLRGGDSSMITVTTVPPTGEAIVGSVYQTIGLTPLLGVLMGGLAGLYFVSPSSSTALTGAVGVAAGVLALLVLLFGTTLVVGVDSDPLGFGSRGVVGPLLVGLGAVLAGGGAAALTRRFVPTESIT